MTYLFGIAKYQIQTSHVLETPCPLRVDVECQCVVLHAAFALKTDLEHHVQTQL